MLVDYRFRHSLKKYDFSKCIMMNYVYFSLEKPRLNNGRGFSERYEK